MISRMPEEWVKAYEEKRSLYANFTTKLHKLFEDLLHTHGIEVAQIESRTKALESFREKLQRPGTSYDADFSVSLLGEPTTQRNRMRPMKVFEI